MKRLIFPLILLVSLSTYSQEMHDEFMPTFIGDKEAFLSTKTGEFVYRAHDKTDVTALYTTDSGIVIHEDRKIHTVKKGETLSVIAKKRGISIADLKAQNKLKSSSLSIGQELKVIIKNVVNSSKPVINKPEGKIIARLAPGQTPGGMTPPDLPPDSMPGSTINLVVKNDAKQPQVKQEANNVAEEVKQDISEDGTITHTVKGGETLFSIARKYKVSIDDLKKENNLALNTLNTGKKLKIKVYNPAVFNQNQKPVEDTKPVTQVAKLETPVKEEVIEKVKDEPETKKEEVKEAIVKEVKEKVAEVAKADVVEEKIEVKEVDANEERTKALIEKYKKKEAPVEPKSDKPSVYVVKKGDTLWSIAKRLHVSIKDLKELNNLTTNDLSIGQELKIK